jgi:hypothetical protein
MVVVLGYLLLVVQVQAQEEMEVLMHQLLSLPMEAGAAPAQALVRMVYRATKATHHLL